MNTEQIAEIRQGTCMHSQGLVSVVSHSQTLSCPVTRGFGYGRPQSQSVHHLDSTATVYVSLRLSSFLSQEGYVLSLGTFQTSLYLVVVSSHHT